MSAQGWQGAALLAAALLLLSGCERPDRAKMESGLIKSGLEQKEAACIADRAARMKGAPYNHLANLLDAGVGEHDAVNRTRRKYTAEFKTAWEAARRECVSGEVRQGQ